VLGPRTAQLNRTYVYENAVTDNQLRSFNHIRLFTEDIGEDYSSFPVLSRPDDSDAPLGRRARAYLDANCASCHRPGGTGFVDMDLTYLPELSEMNLIDVDPTQGNMGIEDAKRIKAGEPDSSILYLRMIDISVLRMPPLAVSIIDSLGTQIIHDWIISLNTTSIKTRNTIVPETFKVSAYPNPFNHQVQIEYQLPEIAYIEIDIFNILGHKVRPLTAGQNDAGVHKIIWDAKDKNQLDLPSSVYLFRITVLTETRKFQKTRKIILLK
jgi:hypothetical protein